MKIPPPEKFVPKLFRVGLPYLIPILALTSFRLLLPVYICDDAYISFRTAHNLAEGNGMVVNPGEWIFVVTSPLWVLLLAGMRAVVHDTVLASVILGFFFEAILLISIVKFSNKLPNGRKTGMLAAVLLCSNPVFLLTSFSGMELALYLFAIVLTMYLLAEGRFTLGLTVAAVAVWIRFDGFLVYFAALTWSFWAQRGEIRSNSKVLLLRYLPSLALVAGYLLIGFLLFETMIPTSVLRKASLSPDVFSTQWFTGAFTISKEFLRSFVGKSSYWYVANTPFLFLSVPLVIGVVRTILDKGKALIPLVGFTLLYVFSFVATGNFYARVHPWYFAPVLPAAYLFVGVGCVWVFSTVGKKFTYFRSFSRYGILELIFVGIWTGFMLTGPDTQAVKKLFSMNSGRERLYAAGAVWAGTYLDKGSTIAASEIGAIGFFSPGDISVLDMFGLLRHKQEVNTKYIKLLRRDRPELILTRVLFEDRMRVEKAMMGSYVWFGFRTLEIGVRSDLVDELSPHLDELPGIYETLDIRKEYSWSRGLKMGIDEQ